MISPIQLEKVEKRLLLQHYRKSQSSLIRERAHAVLLNNQGYSIYKISKALFRTEKTVREWVKNFHKGRISSLFPGYFFNQNAAKLTREQKKQIRKIISKPPSAYGIPYAFWSVKALKTYIKAEFGVEYESNESYRLVFKLSNYSYHLPAKFNIKRDEKAIEERMEEIYKEIIPLLENDDWKVYVADEARIIWETIIRRAWLPKGKKTILKTYTKRKSQSFLGMLNLKTGEPDLYKLSWQNQEQVIKALTRFKKKHSGRKLCLIWDNASFHKGKLIQEELKKGNKLYGIYLINLPPHAPDKNPQEHVWRYAKDEIANYSYKSLEDVVARFKRIIMGRTFVYEF